MRLRSPTLGRTCMAVRRARVTAKAWSMRNTCCSLTFNHATLAVQAGRRLAQHHGHASLRGWRCASRWEVCQPRQHSRSTVRGLNVWRDVRSHSSSPRPARGWCEQSGSFCCAQHGHSSSAVRCLIGCPCFPQVVKAEMRSAAQHLDVGLPAQLTRRTLAMTDAGSGTSGAQHCRRCSALA